MNYPCNEDVLTREDYNLINNHLNAISEIISKYNYISNEANRISKLHSIQCRITDIKQDMLTINIKKSRNMQGEINDNTCILRGGI